MGKLLKRIGGLLFWAGAAALAGIFIVVLANGTWPDFLAPVQTLFAALGTWTGNFALVIEGLLFLGPGLLLFKAGEALEAKQQQA